MTGIARSSFHHWSSTTTDRADRLAAHIRVVHWESAGTVVLDGGAVAEQGTHEELLHADGKYARLFRLQAAGYQKADQSVVVSTTME